MPAWQLSMRFATRSQWVSLSSPGMRSTKVFCAESMSSKSVKRYEDGKVIEDYPEDKYGPICLILGFTGGRKAGARALQPSFPLINQDHHRLRTEPESMDRL